MPIETFAFIDSLVVTDPIHTDALSEADSHLRGIKQTLKSTFPNVAGAVSATDVELSAAGGAFGAPGYAQISPNGTVASGTLLLAGVVSGSNVQVTNTQTGTGDPGLSVLMVSGTTAVAPLTLSKAGVLATTGAVNSPSIQKGGHELIPSGVIVMWAGSLATVPAGWTLCDGTSGAPDLRNRFILGAGGTGFDGPGVTGGQFTTTPTTSTAGSHAHGGITADSGAFAGTWGTDAQGTHTHTGSTAGHALITNELPPHQHQVPGTIIGGTTAGQSYLGLGADQSLSAIASGASVQNTSVSDQVGAGWVHTHDIYSDGSHAHSVGVSVGNHNHGINLDGSHSHTVSVSTTPPFFALAFIMKL